MNKEKLKENKKAKKVGIISGVVFAAFFPFVILFLLNWIADLKLEELSFFSFFKTNNNTVAGWFSFLGSYLGAVVTVIIGLITYNFSKKVEKINSQNNNFQNRISIISNIPNMKCKSLKLHNLDKNGLPDVDIEFFEKIDKYILKLLMEPPFPPYFHVRITSIELNMEGEKLN